MKIFAYADTKGSENYNEQLSKKRVYVVYNYLRSHCYIDTTKVYIEWLGESPDGYDLHFPQAHLQERCADVWVTFYDYNKMKN